MLGGVDEYEVAEHISDKYARHRGIHGISYRGPQGGTFSDRFLQTSLLLHVQLLD